MNETLLLSVETQAAADLVALLREQMDGEDDDLLRDMVEGETDLVEAIRAAMDRLEYLEDDAGAADARIKQLQARKSSRQASIERLKELLLRAIERTGLAPFREPGRYTLTAAKDKAKVSLECDPAYLPERFMKVLVEPKKRDLLEALQAGETIEGVSLVEGGTHLVIRRT